MRTSSQLLPPDAETPVLPVGGHPAGTGTPPSGPSRRTAVVPLGDAPVLIRSVRRGDGERIDRFVRELSHTTRYRRFHTGMTRLSARHLAWLVEVDHHDRETLLAFAGGTLIGLGQYVRDGLDHADVAVVVADEWQRRGVGRALSQHLRHAALEAGITAFGASVLADNPGPLNLARSVSPDVVAQHDRTALDLTIPLVAAA